MDYSNLKKLLSDSLKQKIEEEASSLNLIRTKKGNKLPIWFITRWDPQHTVKVENTLAGGYTFGVRDERSIWII